MKKVTIPIEPSEALLKSMAMRYNHSFFIDGILDEEILKMRNSEEFSSRLMGGQFLTSQEKKVY